MMESTRQKTFKLLKIILSGSVVSFFILLLSSAHSTADKPGQSFSQAALKNLGGPVSNMQRQLAVDVHSDQIKNFIN